MLRAITSPTPDFSSEYGAVSRELPQPLERPDTITENPPFLMSLRCTRLPRRPTRQYSASVSS